MDALTKFEAKIKHANTLRLCIYGALLIIVIALTNIFRLGSIQSCSMLPSLKVGDCVLYSTVYDFNNVSVGDIILYKSVSGKIIIHRVIEKNLDENNELYYIVKGDNNEIADATHITSANYKGRVYCTIKSKAIASYIYDLAGADKQARAKAIGITIGTIVAVWLLVFMFSILRDKRIEAHRQKLKDTIEEADNMTIPTKDVVDSDIQGTPLAATVHSRKRGQAELIDELKENLAYILDDDAVTSEPEFDELDEAEDAAIDAIKHVADMFESDVVVKDTVTEKQPWVTPDIQEVNETITETKPRPDKIMPDKTEKLIERQIAAYDKRKKLKTGIIIGAAVTTCVVAGLLIVKHRKNK